jgi:hypothetical protein
LGSGGGSGRKARDGWVMCIACIERGIHELFELNLIGEECSADLCEMNVR